MLAAYTIVAVAKGLDANHRKADGKKELSTLNLSDEYQRVTCGQTCTKALRQKCSRRRIQSRPVQEPRSGWHEGNISYGLHAMRDETTTLQCLHCHSISGLNTSVFLHPSRPDSRYDPTDRSFSAVIHDSAKAALSSFRAPYLSKSSCM